jgi:hypothetical protein
MKLHDSQVCAQHSLLRIYTYSPLQSTTMATNKAPEFKLVLVGDGGVGMFLFCINYLISNN